ncbi:MAG: DUF4838 domain-containing protein [bacterium]
MRNHQKLCGLVTLAAALALSAGPLHALTLVRDGEPTSVIVTREHPAPSQQKAAEELQYHLEQMSGATVPIVAESDLDASDADASEATRIYVGQSEALKAQGIDTSTFEPETLMVRTLDRALVLAGDDRGAHDEPFYGDLHTGTLYAVYDFLQDELGCRWVWSGPTGEVIPKRKTIEIGELSVKETPQLIRRHFRAGLRPYARDFGWRYYPRYMEGEMAAHYEPLMLDERHWLKRMRMGKSDKPHYGHAFTLWYERYHDEHPEIFAKQPDGHRGLPNTTYSRKFVKMCVTSDKLVDMLIEQFKAQREKNPNHRWLNACENDGGLGFCVCEACRALDVTLNEEVRSKLKARGWTDEQIEHEYAPGENGLPNALSNRYFHFYNKLARRLAEVAPDAYVVAYAYTNYQYAPIDMELEPNILVGLIGFNHYPMTEDDRQREINNLKAWTDAGIEALFFRPNSFYFSVGHGVPWDATTQMAGDFKHLLDGGILATDFDRLNGHWSTAARTYYVLGRQHWDTQKSVDELNREFAEAFGPAADAIDQYYDHWETVAHEAYTRPDLDEIAKQVDAYGGRIGKSKALSVLLTEEDFERGREILAQARSAAQSAKKTSDDQNLLTRIDILELGLKHGELMREGTKFTIDRKYEESTRYEDHWPTVVEAFEAREKLADLRAHNVFWLNNFELISHDPYGMRVYHDFYERPYMPVLTPIRKNWKFIPDPDDVGESEGWHRRTLKESEALQPWEWPQYRHLFYSTWDQYPPVTAWKRETGEQAVVNGWYQIDFAIAAQDLQDRNVLYIPYLKGKAKIWIDDQLVREISPGKGTSKDAIVLHPDEVGIEAGKSFRLTIKVHSPDEPGGLIGPVYVAKPRDL